MSDITRVLKRMESDPAATEQLLPLVYDELRKLAAQKMAHEQPGQTLQATALVHEAYLRLLGPDQAESSWDSRGHFFAAAAEAMRRILVENARRKKRLRHGGGRRRVELDSGLTAANEPDDTLAIDDALSQLAAEDRIAAELVKLHVFGGLPIEDAAETLELSRTTAYRLWAYARAWLRAAVERGDDNADR